uniref:G-protein coupled receptors family 1 profile domain-containing protein n=1 Tax=Branchiostoma floridae TaxID=7739 RepID=C3XYV8_BRAFL|eukprot:XP_002610983.1 hypothetical protein BRAFLDRAFT_96287 [Branchiostoma floridae]
MMTTPLPPPHHHNSSIPTAWGSLPAETPASPVAATPAVFLPDLPLRSWLFMAGYCALFVLCLVGDIAVAVMVHGLGKRRGGTVYYFVLNLLLADLLIGIFCTPFTLVENTQEDQSLSRVLCRMTPLVEGVVVCGSAFTLAAIAVTRYSQRKHQVSMQAPDVSAKTIAFVLCCIWTIAIAINIPQAFARDLLLTSRPSGEMFTCQETWSNSRAYLLYKGVLVALGFPGPLLFIVFAHVVGVTGLSGLKKNEDGMTFKVTVGNKGMHERRSRDQSTECSEETVISPDRGSNSEERNRLFGGTDGDFMVPEGPHKDLSVSSSINETGDINTVACCAGTSCNNCEASKPAFPGGHAGTAWSSPPRVLSADYSLMLPTSCIDTVEVMCSSAPNTLPGEGVSSHTTNSVEQSQSFIPISGTPMSEESAVNKTEIKAHHCSTFLVSSHLLRALTVLFLVTWLPFYTCWALDTYAKLTNTSCKNIHEYFQPISQWIAFSNSLLTPYVSGYYVGCFRLSCFRAKSDKSAAEVETPEEEQREEEEEEQAEEMKTEMEEENPVTWI